MTPAITAKLASAATTAGRHAGATQDLPERRGGLGYCGSPSTSPARASSSAIVRGSGPDQEGDTESDDAHRRGGEPGDDERIELEVLPGEQRPEHERPQRGAEERAEEDVRDRASFLLLRVHVRGRRSRQQDATVHRTNPYESEDHQRSAVDDAPERGQHAREHSHDEAACDHRYPTEPVHQASGGQRCDRAGRQEDRGPEAEDGLDAGYEDEGDRRHGGGELQHARKEDQA